MMSSRSYRPAMTSAACRREIERNSGIMHDPLRGRRRAGALGRAGQPLCRGRHTPDALLLTGYSWSTPAGPRLPATHRGSRIPLPELAARFHLSQSSLKICFRRCTACRWPVTCAGCAWLPPPSFCRRADLPVAEIAHRVGYEDPSRFCRGLPPPHRPPPHRAAAGSVPGRSSGPASGV